MDQFLYVDTIGVQVLWLFLADYSYICLNGTDDIACPSSVDYRRVQNEYNEGFDYFQLASCDSFANNLHLEGGDHFRVSVDNQTGYCTKYSSQRSHYLNMTDSPF